MAPEPFGFCIGLNSYLYVNNYCQEMIYTSIIVFSIGNMERNNGFSLHYRNQLQGLFYFWIPKKILNCISGGRQRIYNGYLRIYNITKINSEER